VILLQVKGTDLKKQEEYDYKVLDMEIMTDHVHLLLHVNPRNTGGIFRILSNIKVAYNQIDY
jgi:REP element-mobilizing transposase RayT